eukprot:Pgem_evm1s1472
MTLCRFWGKLVFTLTIIILSVSINALQWHAKCENNDAACQKALNFSQSSNFLQTTLSIDHNNNNIQKIKRETGNNNNNNDNNQKTQFINKDAREENTEENSQNTHEENIRKTKRETGSNNNDNDNNQKTQFNNKDNREDNTEENSQKTHEDDAEEEYEEVEVPDPVAFVTVNIAIVM